jgi:hypothetical protein
MLYHSFISVGTIFFASLVALAQQSSQPGYQTLLEKAYRADPMLDFKALRLAYAETPQYDPYDTSRELQSAILKALGEKKYEQCLTYVDKALAKNYVDINAHFAAYRAHMALKNPDKARFHHYMMDGLIQSILASGDGKTPTTAIVVISTEEEYAILDAVGMKRVSQSFVKLNGHVYDLIVAREEKGAKEHRLHFNIDRQYEWLRKSLETGKK